MTHPCIWLVPAARFLVRILLCSCHCDVSYDAHVSTYVACVLLSTVCLFVFEFLDELVGYPLLWKFLTGSTPSKGQHTATSCLPSRPNGYGRNVFVCPRLI